MVFSDRILAACVSIWRRRTHVQRRELAGYDVSLRRCEQWHGSSWIVM